MKTTLLAAGAAVGLDIAPASAADMPKNSGHVYPDFWGGAPAAGAHHQGPAGAVERCDDRHLHDSVEPRHLIVSPFAERGLTGSARQMIFVGVCFAARVGALVVARFYPTEVAPEPFGALE